MKVVKSRRKVEPQVIRALSSIAYASKLNSLATKRILLAMRSTNEQEKKKLPSPKSVILEKLNFKNIFICISVATTLIAGFMSWNNDIITAQISQLEAQNKENTKLLERFNNAAFESRNTILNQYDMCNIQKRYPGELMVERRNSIKNISILSGSIRSTYGMEVWNTISKMVSTMYEIDDVCNINKNQFDNYIEYMIKNVNNTFNSKIADNNNKIKELIKKRHRLDPIKF